MTIAEKYRKVLEISKIKIYKAEDKCGFGRNTLKNAIDNNRLLSDEYHKTFIETFHVNEAWWRTEKGEVILEKGTYVEIPSVSTKDPVEENRILKEVIRRMGETNDYLLKRIKDLESGQA